MAEVTLRTRKFIRNPLLGRKQMVVYVRPSQYTSKRTATAYYHARRIPRSLKHTRNHKAHSLTSL